MTFFHSFPCRNCNCFHILSLNSVARGSHPLPPFCKACYRRRFFSSYVSVPFSNPTPALKHNRTTGVLIFPIVKLCETKGRIGHISVMAWRAGGRAGGDRFWRVSSPGQLSASPGNSSNPTRSLSVPGLTVPGSARYGLIPLFAAICHISSSNTPIAAYSCVLRL